MSVMIVTSLGDLVVDLFTDRCPLTCKNFLKLCKIKYYNGCLFHTVQKDFTAQTGDPTGKGSGGDSVYKFLYGEQARFFGDEIHLDLKHSKKGTIAMASAGENVNASQFYITLRDDLDYLDGKHTVFGEVAEGIDTLDRINEAYIDEKGRPYKNIRIKHTYVLDDPFDDPQQLAEFIPDASPEGKPKDEVEDEVRLEDDWVPMDDQLGTQELEEVLREKAAHSSAVVLESIGDIPEAEVKPPDNVLFVCKLNPVTEDEDLHTIFSRFGTVTSADIIRDFKTGDSLCYAFIEFEDREACEQAYFKMDNALIDDRRIHVDFSQSVSKLWSQYRRKGQNKGGCFKCGSLDHIAKDCPGDSGLKQHQPKYILKDDTTQRGGDDNSRYEMVFDDDTTGSPRPKKQNRGYEEKHHDEKYNGRGRNPDDLKDRDKGQVSRDSHRQSTRCMELREDDSSRGNLIREDYRRDRDHRAKDGGDQRRKPDGSSQRDRRDDYGRGEQVYEKRRDDSDQRGDRVYEKRHDGDQRGDRVYEKRRDETDQRGDRVYEKRRNGTDQRGGRSYEKRRDGTDQRGERVYEKRHHDIDNRDNPQEREAKKDDYRRGDRKDAHDRNRRH